MEPSEYKHVVLSLIFLKFTSDKFEEHRAKLIVEGKEKYIDMPDFYNMNNVFFLEEISRWNWLIKQSKQDDIALKIDTALHTIEKNNKSLKGALPDNYFSRLGLDVSKLASLLDTINDIDTTKDPKHDLVGRVYEYFLSKFALAEGKGKGEFYTPKSIVNLIAEMIEPYKGTIYDPACGSGGMFVQSIKFIEEEFQLPKITNEVMLNFDKNARLLFEIVKLKSRENQMLVELKNLFFSKLVTTES